MRVERVGVDKVRERLKAKKREDEERRNAAPRPSAIKEYEQKLKVSQAGPRPPPPPYTPYRRHPLFLIPA
jgi:hypothetical protein